MARDSLNCFRSGSVNANKGNEQTDFFRSPCAFLPSFKAKRKKLNKWKETFCPCNYRGNFKHLERLKQKYS